MIQFAQAACQSRFRAFGPFALRQWLRKLSSARVDHLWPRAATICPATVSELKSLGCQPSSSRLPCARPSGETLVSPSFLSSLILSIAPASSSSAWSKCLFSLEAASFSARLRPPFAPLSARSREDNADESSSKSARELLKRPSELTNLPSEMRRSRKADHLRIDTPQTPDSHLASSGIGPPRSYMRSRQRL